MLCRVALVRSTTPCNIPEDAILHSHHRDNFKSYLCNITITRFLYYVRIEVVMMMTVMWYRMSLVIPNVSKEHITSIYRVVRICELGAMLALSSRLMPHPRRQHSSGCYVCMYSYSFGF
jgi:hypothetical protein